MNFVIRTILFFFFFKDPVCNYSHQGSLRENDRFSLATARPRGVARGLTFVEVLLPPSENGPSWFSLFLRLFLSRFLNLEIILTLLIPGCTDVAVEQCAPRTAGQVRPLFALRDRTT